ncbi:MAG: pyridoxamine 5'-phosphate oxidase [Sphingomonas sp.]
MTTDPYALFNSWLSEAEASEPNDPNAVAVATVDTRGQPSVRMVLLKGHDTGFPGGFIFYTNQTSRKAHELTGNPRAGMLFYWKTLRRQVRIDGPVTPVSDAEADTYFATRGRISRLGAWASDQSSPLADRATLETQLAEVTARFEGQDVPRPPHWSGYRVTPEAIEFWEDGDHRLHNRRLFTRSETGWIEGLLYP